VIDEEIESLAVVVMAVDELHEDEEEVDEEEVEETFLFSPQSRISLAILFSLSFSEFKL